MRESLIASSISATASGQYISAAARIIRALKHYKCQTELNLGVLCGSPSGVVVLDIDVKHDGLSQWNRQAELHDPFDTFTVRTGGGGLHMYFRYAGAATTLETGTNYRYRGWDIRSNMGQVLGPYSIHPTTGAVYQPISGFAEVASVVTPHFCDMPAWLLE